MDVWVYSEEEQEQCRFQISKTDSKAQEATVTMCCGYLTPKQKCFQLSLKLFVAYVLL